MIMIMALAMGQGHGQWAKAMGQGHGQRPWQAVLMPIALAARPLDFLSFAFVPLLIELVQKR